MSRRDRGAPTAPPAPPGRIEVKICGLRTVAGARACAAAGADYAGLNFAPGSARRVAPARAARLLPRLGATAAVGVFRHQPLGEIVALAEELGLRWLQLHGEEPPAMGAQLAGRFALVKAVSDRALDLEARGEPGPIAAWAPLVRRFLVDGREPGSGRVWDHDRLLRAGLRGGRLRGVGVWVAGGLGPDNVAETIGRLRPAGVDVASGIEQDGREDPDLIAAFCLAARGGAGARRAREGS